MRRLVLLLAAVALGGCVLKRSEGARLYVLDARATPREAAATAGPRPVLGVLRVSVPAWVDRPELTLRAADGEVVVQPGARWGEPIGRGLQRVISEDLAMLLPERDVLSAPFAPRQPVHQRLEVTITEAARQADGEVLLEARWRVLGTDGIAVAQGRSSQRAKAAAGNAGTVAGLSDALARVGEEIAETLRRLP